MDNEPKFKINDAVNWRHMKYWRIVSIDRDRYDNLHFYGLVYGDLIFAAPESELTLSDEQIYHKAAPDA